MFVDKIKKFIFKKISRMDLDVFQLTYHTKSGLTPRYFSYTMFVENYQTEELEFTNELSGEILTILKNDLSDYKTRPLRINEN